MVQKELIYKCNQACKTVVTATQMLDSMIKNPRPTRAEATDVANSIWDGTDAIMLSGETAAGKYPVESVRTMSNIAIKVEETLDYKELLDKKNNLLKEKGVTKSLSYALCSIALDLDFKAIISITSSGFTPRCISQFRPKAPIIASTTDIRVYRQLCLDWGVIPILMPYCSGTDKVVSSAINLSLKLGLITKGDTIALAAGDISNVSGMTNFIKVKEI